MSLIAQQDLSDLSFSLAHFWNEVKADSPELVKKLEQWQALVHKAQTLLANFPKEIKNRDFYKNALSSFEQSEIWARQYLEGLAKNGRSYKESFNTQLIRARQQGHELSLSLLNMKNNSFIQKFIEGKKIMASRKQLQWGRKAFHIINSVGGLCLYLFSGITEHFAMMFLIGYLALALTLEVLRATSPKFGDLICRSFSGIMREKERHGITSATYFLISALFVVYFFPKPVVALAILYVGVGDPAAGIIGSYFGKHKINDHASWEGLFGCFMACFACTYLFTGTGFIEGFQISGLPLLGFAILGGLIGMLAEGLFPDLEDNLVIPLASAPALWVLLKLFH